jgi:hypothetical protein
MGLPLWPKKVIDYILSNQLSQREVLLIMQPKIRNEEQEVEAGKPLLLALMEFINYTQPVGFGNPAYLHACFAGPAGKSS